MKTRRSFCLSTVVCAVVVGVGSIAGSSSVSAANILWVSDAPPGSATGGVFSGAGSNYTDSAFVRLLQNAGHNVTRFNNPDAGATNLTAAEIAAINTNDLIITGRASGSGAWLNNQATNWNRDIIRPLIIMSPYLVRSDGNRLGWFGGGNGNLPDNTPVSLTPGSGADPVIDYIFGGVDMSGTNTTQFYDEAMDRNTSHIVNAPVAGATVIATAHFAREDNGVTNTGNAIVGFPAGTAVRAGADILPAYRMFFAGGTRESATAPNGIPQYTGRENLTSAGEDIFLRAVAVALNNGAAPITNSGPVGITSSPTNITVLQGQPVSFSITVTGAAPRLLQWQRDDGAGSFTNIQDAVIVFARSSFRLPAAAMADNNAQFRVVVSNSFNVVTSGVAQLTVTADTLSPVVLSAGSLGGSSVVVCFNEAVDPNSALEEPNYQFNSGTGPNVIEATIRPDGRSVFLALDAPIAATATLDISFIGDLNGNVPDLPTTVVVTNSGLTAVDIGPVNPVGTNNVCNPNKIEISGGGLDINQGGGRIDNMRVAYRTVTGDFDARVRVDSFVGTFDHFETTAKALLVARQSNATNAPAVNVWITPRAPGDDNIASSARTAANGVATALGTTVTPNGLPNVWLRITRVGDLFTTYRGTNGIDWIPFGSATVAMGPTADVGLGAVSHRSGKLVTATFSDFKIALVPSVTVLTNWAYNAGTFSAAFASQTGFNYTVEYKNDLSATLWNTLTNVAGDGALKTFTDSAVSPTGARFYRVAVQ